MSAFILDITNQIENVQVENVENFIDKIVFHALFTPKKTSCPCCGCAEAWHKGKKNRKLRIAPLGNKMAWLILGIHRLQCTTCQHVW